MKRFKTIEPLSNFQIINECKKLKIKSFKSVFTRDELKSISSAVSATKNARAADAYLAETQRHNKEVESQLKSGQGMLSDLAGKIPVFGAVIKYGLLKRGLGLSDCNKVAKGECICLGKGLYLKHTGSGLFLGPQGARFFLDQNC